jgi:para-aminobenzoate synthetase component I
VNPLLIFLVKDMQPWHWQSLSLEQRSGSEIFAALFGTEPIGTLLESPGAGSPLARYSICAGGPRQVAGQDQIWTPPLGEIFACLRGFLASADQTAEGAEIQDLPFVGGWLGWLGYEAAWEIEKLPPLAQETLPFPTAYWYQPANFAVLDHLGQRLYLAATDPLELAPMVDRLQQPYQFPRCSVPQIPQISFLTDGASYQAAVRQAQAYIQAGDIYQANLSVRFQTESPIPQDGYSCIDSWQIYRQMQEINPSPFASYWKTPWGEIASCSPERLVRYQHGVAESRPIAGTRPRGQDSDQDRQLAAELLGNQKEIAEHIMLVDLERNDLGKVCRWGSIEVDELLSIERYSHVMHLVSNVRGELSGDCDPIDLLQATFPGGTITGCPKVRCMEIIAELEPYPRNLFYGSCGYLDRRGYLDLNILIRTLLCSQGKVWGQVGAGIVADSDPEREWQESLQKALAQIRALGVPAP